MRRQLSEKSIFKNQIFKSKQILPEGEKKDNNIHVRRLSKLAGLENKDSSKGTNKDHFIWSIWYNLYGDSYLMIH